MSCWGKESMMCFPGRWATLVLLQRLLLLLTKIGKNEDLHSVEDCFCLNLAQNQKISHAENTLKIKDRVKHSHYLGASGPHMEWTVRQDRGAQTSEPPPAVIIWGQSHKVHSRPFYVLLTWGPQPFMCMLSYFSHVKLFCNPMDCSPPGSSVHRILEARILEWVAMPSSRESFPPRDQTQVSCIAGATTEGPCSHLTCIHKTYPKLMRKQ